MQAVGKKLICTCHGLERFIVKNHPRLGLLCQQGADELKEGQPKETDYKKKCWDMVSKFTRLSWADEKGECTCITCPLKVNWMDFDCGHFQTREDAATFLHPQNLAPQCQVCNRFAGGRPEKFAIAIDKLYGKGTAEMLRALSKTTLHRSNYDYKILYFDYKQKFQEEQFKRKHAA